MVPESRQCAVYGIRRLDQAMFAVEGKQGIKLQELLSHRAGSANAETAFTLEKLACDHAALNVRAASGRTGSRAAHSAITHWP